jgi:hypothetical protein
LRDHKLPLLLGLLRFVLNASGPIKQPLGVQRVPQIIGSKRLPRRCSTRRQRSALGDGRRGAWNDPPTDSARLRDGLTRGPSTPPDRRKVL